MFFVPCVQKAFSRSLKATTMRSISTEEKCHRYNGNLLPPEEKCFQGGFHSLKVRAYLNIFGSTPPLYPHPEQNRRLLVNAHDYFLPQITVTLRVVVTGALWPWMKSHWAPTAGGGPRPISSGHWRTDNEELWIWRGLRVLGTTWLWSRMLVGGPHLKALE